MIGDLTEDDNAKYVYIIGHQHSKNDLYKYGITLDDLNTLKSIDNNEALRDFLLSKGIDGIVYYNDWEDPKDGRYSYIAFKPNQIKLTTTINPTSSNRINEDKHFTSKQLMNNYIRHLRNTYWKTGGNTESAVNHAKSCEKGFQKSCRLVK